MAFRTNFLPRTSTDWGCVALIYTFVPITFWFLFYIVLPEIHDPDGIYMKILWIGGLFWLHNIMGNLIAIMVVDTSIKHHIFRPPTIPKLRRAWRFCSICESVVPPRSWHCSTCRTCILKRDHHCHFVGCCVGHNNHRYFMLLLVYMTIGSIFSAAYIAFYCFSLHGDVFLKGITLLKVVCPMLMCFIDVSWYNFYLLIFELNVIATFFTLVIFVHHSDIFRKGSIVYEQGTTIYDLGLLQNIKMLLGQNMYYAWISPLIISPLPHDGIQWEKITMNIPKRR